MRIAADVSESWPRKFRQPHSLLNHRADPSQERYQQIFFTTKVGNHRRIHFLTAYFVKVNEVAGLFGQLRAERALNAAIAFPERMSGINFTHVVGQTIDKTVWRQSDQISLIGNFGKLKAEITFNPVTVAKAAATFADINPT